jgi:hypothetical protein
MGVLVAAVMGRSLLAWNGEQWEILATDIGSDRTAAGVQCLVEWASPRNLRSAILIYEPEGMVHTILGAPAVARASLASMAKFKEDFPSLDATHPGWGYDALEARLPMGPELCLHVDASPLLELIGEALASLGITLSAAWSLYSIAAHIAAEEGVTRCAGVLFCLGNQVVQVCLGSARSVRHWALPLPEGTHIACEASPIEAAAAPGAARGRAPVKSVEWLLVRVDGDSRDLGVPESWDTMRAIDWAQVVGGLRGMRGQSQANLATGLVRKIEISRYLRVASLVGLVGAAVLAAAAGRIHRNIASEEAAAEARITSLSADVRERTAAKAEMERLLKTEEALSDDHSVVGPAVLVSISKAVPSTAYLVGLEIESGGSILLVTRVARGARLSADELRASISHAGISDAIVEDNHDGRFSIKCSWRGDVP